ncbi:MAG TPA: DNA polymerase III subunit delta' [Xanthomonadaceae bacterium]|nr:DNA polymerase III subunit delta' [Xanthomonadaceae bacterium]
MSATAPAFDAPLAPWQQRAYDQATAAIDAGRLGHALLFCGPAGLGKRRVAERLALRLLCRERDPAGEACGRCRACHLFAVRTQADPLEVRPDGTPSHPWGHSGHPDAIFVGHAVNPKTGKIRSEIVIDQVRALSERFALTPQLGDVQVALLDPADEINHSASNALLKTLEEPQPGRHLWLVSASPTRLPATIRSRCQRVELRLPPRAEALAWLATQGHAAAAAAEALEAARGHPGLAAAWLRDGGLALRREVAGDLAQLQGGRTAPIAMAQRWVADGQGDARLRHAADLALEAARGGLTDPRGARRLAAWFDAANRARDLLRTQVRSDLVVAEVLLGWRDASAPVQARSRR